MREITFELDNCLTTETVYEWNEGYLPQPSDFVVKGRGNNKVVYINDIIGAYDIETYTIVPDNEDEQPFAYMYIWQCALNDMVFMGRTWKELVNFFERIMLQYKLNEKKRIVFYVHSLSFEFQHTRNFVEFEDVFATALRKVVKCRYLGIEFRCSYKLSNMSLERFIKNTPNAKYFKRSGKKYDYRKLRLPTTYLDDEEMGYSYCDVRGLVEAVKGKLIEDTVATIPLTSTGYVRRKARSVMRGDKECMQSFYELELDSVLYAYCKQSVRGGNTHANAIWTCEIVSGCKSKDKKSSYPSVIVCSDRFPTTRFREVKPKIFYCKTKAVLMDITINDISTKKCPVPYISFSKCVDVKEPYIDNGRIVSAESLRTVITDVDWEIIENTYNYSDIIIHRMYIAERGKLPYALRKLVYDDFAKKCELQNGDKYLYNKFKNMLNSYFGMMLTDILHHEYVYSHNEWIENKLKHEQILEHLNKYYHGYSGFLSYQHGIWVTAIARLELQKAIDLLGDDLIYSDTDSAKYIGDHESDFEELNRSIMKQCEENDIPAYYTMQDGNRIYLGLWESEYDGKEFEMVTLGAKKYAVQTEDSFDVTVSGLAKESGSAWFKEHGGLIAFKPYNAESVPWALVPAEKSGRTVSYYNDVEEPYWIKYKGCDIQIGSNIGVVDTTYRLSISAEYAEYIDGAQEFEGITEYPD